MLRTKKKIIKHDIVKYRELQSVNVHWYISRFLCPDVIINSIVSVIKFYERDVENIGNVRAIFNQELPNIEESQVKLLVRWLDYKPCVTVVREVSNGFS